MSIRNLCYMLPKQDAGMYGNLYWNNDKTE